MVKRSAQKPHSLTSRQKKAEADLGAALRNARKSCRLSQEGAARLMGVAKSTVARWERLEVDLNAKIVLAAERLGPAFKRALCTYDHSDHVEGD